MGDNLHYMNTKQATSHSLGAALKQLFKLYGHSQDDVSLGTGIAITSLNRKLNSGIFRYEELASIADFLGVKLSTIVQIAEELQEGKSFAEAMSPTSAEQRLTVQGQTVCNTQEMEVTA